MQITPLAQIDPDAIEALLDAAFGTDRHGRTAYLLREGVDAVAALSFAATDAAGGLQGTIQCWPCGLYGDDNALLQKTVLVGPVAVQPGVQGEGIGKALMDAMLEAAATHADGPLCMIGDPEYYGRFFGFTADDTGGWTLPGPFEPRRLLARAVGSERIVQAGRLRPRL